MNKIDKISREINLKDKTLFAAQQKVETLEYKIKKYVTKIEELTLESN
jgi:archaellum component FlaC